MVCVASGARAALYVELYCSPANFNAKAQSSLKPI